MIPSSIPAALCSYLDTAARPPFSWADNNCCHFAAGWWQRMTGIDALAGFAMPAGPLAARRLLLAAGSAGQPQCTPAQALLGLVGQRTGRAPILASLAQVGDVVAVRMDGLADVLSDDAGANLALGICCGRTAVLLAEDGATMHVPMAGALCAWALRGAA